MAVSIVFYIYSDYQGGDPEGKMYPDNRTPWL